MLEKDVGELYKHYYADIYRYVYMLTLNSFDTEDILQNVFICVIRGICRFRGESNIKTWLFAIARNEYLNFTIKNNKNMEDISNITIAVNFQVDEFLLKKEEVNTIIIFIQKQEEPVKSLLVLRLIDEKSFVEIGTILNKSETWCRVTFFRLKKKMVDLLEE